MSKSDRAVKARVLALALGCVVALGGFELTLRAIGGIENFERRLHVRSGDSESFTILCLGNSYTAGAGAPAGNSYCDYLRKRIDMAPELASKKIRVINLGQGNYNSEQILQDLPENIEKYHPDLALIMAGEPNQWNRLGFSRYLERTRSNGEISFLSRAGVKLYDVLYASSVFRFSAMIYEKLKVDVMQHLAPKSLVFSDVKLSDRRVLGLRWFGSLYQMRLLKKDWLSPADIEEALSALKDLAVSREAEGGDRELARTIAMIYRDLNEFDHALDWYERSLRVHPEVFNFDVYDDLNRLLPLVSTDRRERVSSLLSEAKKTYPGDQVYNRLVLFFHGRTGKRTFNMKGSELDRRVSLIEMQRKIRPDDEDLAMELYGGYIRQKRALDALDVLGEMIKRNPFGAKDPLVPLLFVRREAEGKSDPHERQISEKVEKLIAQYRKDFPDEEVSTHQVSTPSVLANWIDSNLADMAELLTAKKVKFIFQTYPPKRDFSMRIADKEILKFVRERGYPLSDTLEYFNSVVFKKVVDRNSVYSDWSGPNDDHLNSEGYRMLGDFLFESIQKYGYFPK